MYEYSSTNFFTFPFNSLTSPLSSINSCTLIENKFTFFYTHLTYLVDKKWILGKVCIIVSSKGNWWQKLTQFKCYQSVHKIQQLYAWNEIIFIPKPYFTIHTCFQALNQHFFQIKSNVMDLTIGQHDHSGIHGFQW